ncbi:hypothetical protein R1flu_004621 [Riccia fluitans]|uniref:Uncharacterized protein n=1 Tax=Riccia fluitans TaxID=41844 RepID=A0ABD1YUV1_9MARC
MSRIAEGKLFGILCFEEIGYLKSLPGVSVKSRQGFYPRSSSSPIEGTTAAVRSAYPVFVASICNGGI